MWLIDVNTLKLVEFIGLEDVPKYAILSHTWGKDEGSFQDITGTSEEYKQKEGFRKIKRCCEQAEKDNLEWAWVDTCCIDKKSSAELSEAINSMFQYYRKSAVCYAYLADIHSWKDQELGSSRWFTRGWTLQDLIAPIDLHFFSSQWDFLGTRYQLSPSIERITSIDGAILRLGRTPQFKSIVKRMTWASNRQTTRVEDLAYCLLGLFGVNMPLLYGEGKRAFIRLQEEIWKISSDQSLFAWGHFDDRSNYDMSNVISSGKLLNFPIQHFSHPRGQHASIYTCTILEEYDYGKHCLKGLFAQSPSDFAEVGHLMPLRGWSTDTQEQAILTCGETRIKLPVLVNDKDLSFFVVVLGCSLNGTSDSVVGVLIREWDSNVVGRLSTLLKFSGSDMISCGLGHELLRSSSCWLHFKAQSVFNLQPKGYVVVCQYGAPTMASNLYRVQAIGGPQDGPIASLRRGPTGTCLIIQRPWVGPLAILVYVMHAPGSLKTWFLCVQLGLFPCVTYERTTPEILFKVHLLDEDEMLKQVTRYRSVLYEGIVRNGAWQYPQQDNFGSVPIGPIRANDTFEDEATDEDEPWQSECNLATALGSVLSYPVRCRLLGQQSYHELMLSLSGFCTLAMCQKDSEHYWMSTVRSSPRRFSSEPLRIWQSCMSSYFSSLIHLALWGEFTSSGWKL